VYKVELTKAAEKELSKLSKDLQTRIAKAIDGLTAEPRPSGVKKLTDGENLYRLRVGDYRVLYEIREATLVVLVVKVADRKEVYRLLP